MKIFIFTIVLISSLYAQSYIGISISGVDYSNKLVSDSFNTIGNNLKYGSVGIGQLSKNNFKTEIELGGVYLFKNSMIDYGISVSYSSGKSHIKFNDDVLLLTNEMAVSNYNFQGLLSKSVSVFDRLALLLRCGAGLGLIDIEHNEITRYSNANSDNMLNSSGNEIYFNGRIEFGFEYNLDLFLLSIAYNYTIANPGKVKGSISYTRDSKGQDALPQKGNYEANISLYELEEIEYKYSRHSVNLCLMYAL